MNVYWYDKNVDKNDFKNKSILLLGEFEFFHQGHNLLFEKAKEINTNHYQIGIFLINYENKKYVQTLEDRLYNLAKLGFDFVVVANFNFEFQNTQGDLFINTLINKFNVDTFIVGSDYRFGFQRKFQATDISNMSNKSKVEIIEIMKENNQKISSSRIKEMYEFGELNTLKKIIVNPINVSAYIEGNFLIWNKNLIRPHFGIYFAKITIDDYWYSGLIHFSISENIYFKLINIDKDVNIFNQKVNIVLINIERIIINKRLDLINNQDIENAKSFFSTSIANINKDDDIN